jgi:hypothetical protein
MSRKATQEMIPMARGGARNRSGPPADPNSGRSERRGFKLTALPSEGYQGDVPDFPLPGPTDRELEVWASLWRTPQACAWSLEAWRWMNIADLVRLQVRGEAHDAPVNIATVVRQLRADLGLTPAGLKENGWAIAADELGAKADAKADATSPGPAARKSSRDRLSVVNGGD